MPLPYKIRGAFIKKYSLIDMYNAFFQLLKHILVSSNFHSIKLQIFYFEKPNFQGKAFICKAGVVKIFRQAEKSPKNHW